MTTGLIPLGREFLKKNGATIMAVCASAGVIATAVLAVKATPKAVELIKDDSRKNHDGDPYAYTKTEAVKSAWKCYIPAVIAGGATICCIAGSNVINKRTQESLASAYVLLANTHNQYRGKLKELYGEEAHNNIMDAIVKEQVNDSFVYTPGLCGNSTLDIETANPEVIRTFYDPYSKRYFETTLSRVIQAEYHLNRNYIMGGWVPLNEFYEFLGLEERPGCDDVGWYVSDLEIFWIDFNHHVTVLDDGMEIVVIDMDFMPEPMSDYDI